MCLGTDVALGINLRIKDFGELNGGVIDEKEETDKED